MKAKQLAIAVMILLLSTSISAQQEPKRFGFEVNGGISFPTAQIDASTLNTGGGFEVLLHFRILEHLGAYGGWGWNHFGGDNTFAGNDASFEETGYIIGLQFMHPISTSSFSYYLRAGALYNHIEVEDFEGTIIYDTGHGWGFQGGMGVAYYLTPKISLNSGLKFNTLTRGLDVEGSTKSLNYQYVSLRVGVSIGL